MLSEAHEENRDLQTFLDSLDAPVFLVSEEGSILNANSLARVLSGKPLSEIRGKKGGDVLECRYARLPEGCGKTVHCRACTIRRSVMHTYETGESLHDVPAYQDIIRKGETVNVCFRISTEKAGNIVLLRIDEVLPIPIEKAV
jgi:PAS domain-containing protein